MKISRSLAGAVCAASILFSMNLLASPADSERSEQSANQASPAIAEYAEAARQAAQEHDTPGFVMAFVSSKGVEEFVSHGVMDRVSRDPISEDAQFQIASLSKIQTGIIVRNLVLEGRLDPQRAIVDYLPEDIDPAIVRNLGTATVAQLISYRSGLPRDTSVLERKGNDPMLAPLTDTLLLRDLALAEMVAEPGEAYEYSNLGYALLGYVSERAAGEPFDQLHRKYVVDAFAMDRTMIELDKRARASLATPYRKEDASVATSPWNTGRLAAASGFYSTPRDIARLMTAQISSYREGDNPALHLTSAGLPVTETRFYGYGLNRQSITLDGGTVDLYYHSGDMDGYAGFYTFVPGNDRGVVMLTTRGGAGADRLRSLSIDYVLARAPRS